MRVLFCTTGGLGHLLPLRPLAAALRGRGHEVAWVSAPDALPSLDGFGFERFAAGPGFDVSRRQFRAAFAGGAALEGEQLSAYTFPRLFGAVLAPAMVEGVAHAVRHWRPDFVVHEPAALAAPLVCRLAGLRNVTHGYGLRPPGRYLDDAMRFFGAHWEARGLPVPAAAGLYDHLRLDVAPHGLERPDAADIPGYRFNPYRAEVANARRLPPDVQSALRSATARGPRIYVTFGTVFNRSPALLVAARAAVRLGAAVVVTVGADGDPAQFAGLCGHAGVYRFVDQAALLPHCDLVVSHGGAGTVLGAAAHGVPQLILPQAADHFRNARALSSLEAGRVVEPRRQDAQEVHATMAEVLDRNVHRSAARDLAAEMSAMPDARAAAEWLEAWEGARLAGS